MSELHSSTQLVRKRQIARDFTVSPRTIDNWVAQRIIPVVRVSPRLNLFDPLAVRAALERRFGVKVGEGH